jgi:signal transduction histidine kinase
VQNNLDLNDALSQMERMQKEIVEQKKNSALGHLVTGVAHELNTPIGVSVTGVSHMSSLVDDLIRGTNPCTLTKSQIDKYLNELKETAELCQRSLARSSQLIQEFKQLQSGDDFRHPSNVDLPAFLEDRFNYISYQYPDQAVALSIELEQCDQSYLLPEIPLTKVIDEVLLNAFQHAFQRTVNPRICIKISSLDESDPKKLSISISDNGAGMAEENLEKLFEPFYTSNRSQGAGLGASILYHTVKNQLCGDISVHRRLDKGLRVSLSIPVSYAA